MHPIIALWAHPRSMSTATERIMRERGDLDCAHEPFMYDYYVHRRVNEMPMFDIRPDQPVAYADIRDMLMRRARAKPVFFKDMSYYVWEQIQEDPPFRDALTNCFLIRDPVASIRSYFRLDPNPSCEEIGLESQWHHHQALVARGDTPVVIEAAEVRRSPRDMMAALWARIGLDFRACAFDWQSEDMPQDWQQVGGWHGKVAESSGIRPAAPDEAEQNQRKFEELAERHPVMRDYLAHHQPFYEHLREVALKV